VGDNQGEDKLATKFDPVIVCDDFKVAQKDDESDSKKLINFLKLF